MVFIKLVYQGFHFQLVSMPENLYRSRAPIDYLSRALGPEIVVMFLGSVFQRNDKVGKITRNNKEKTN